MAEENNSESTEKNNLQIKQEHLIYGIAAALVVIVILIGALFYVMQSGGTDPNSGGVTQQLPPGHPQIRDGAVPGPLDPSQIPGYEAPTDGQSQDAQNAQPGQTPAGDAAGDQANQ